MLVPVDPELFKLLQGQIQQPEGWFYSPSSIHYDRIVGMSFISVSDSHGENAQGVYYRRVNILDLFTGYPHIPDADKHSLDSLQTQIALLTGVFLADVNFSQVRICKENILQLVVSDRDPKYAGWIPITY